MSIMCQLIIKEFNKTPMPNCSSFQIQLGIEIPSNEFNSACSEPVIFVGETNNYTNIFFEQQAVEFQLFRQLSFQLKRLWSKVIRKSSKNNKNTFVTDSSSYFKIVRCLVSFSEFFQYRAYLYYYLLASSDFQMYKDF